MTGAPADAPAGRSGPGDGDSPAAFTAAGAGRGLALSLPLALARLGVLLGLKKYWLALALRKALLPLFAVPVRRFRPKAGIFSPLEYLRLRHPGVAGRWRLLVHEFNRSGWTGTMAQVSTPLAINVVIGAAMFTAFRLSLAALSAASPDRSAGAPPTAAASELQHHDLSHIALAGALSGAFQAVLTCPVDQARLRFANHPTEHPCFRTALSTLYRTEGVRGLFRGMPAGVLKECLGVGAFFGLYEVTRRSVLRGLAPDPDPAAAAADTPPPGDQEEEERGLAQRFTALSAVVCGGAVAGVGYRLLTHPIENIIAYQHRHGAPLSVLRFLRTVPRQRWAPLCLRGLHTALRGIVTPAVLGFVVLEAIG